MTKGDLRHAMRRRLRALSTTQRRKKSLLASRQLIGTKVFNEAKTVMMYLSLPYEVDTTQVIGEAWRRSKCVAVPKMRWDDDIMLAVRLNSFSDRFSYEVAGLRNPVSDEEVPAGAIDLVVLPLLAVDGGGNRLGQGGGHYDRFLAASGLGARRCGFAFWEQMVEQLPVVETDQPLHMVVTDVETRYWDASI